mmetsp:Transcript_5983/g.8098  ORF Transcript_5983/g.8098 Transcript_5983/m.8098 type:complete len:152 (-) Transcript_5983:1038-1493(-)|eukprot:CAMPEP_0185573988 /NCGR_PEP_ID=MMETSP0434-20130131/5555_1 /TAXON_ID=626734 ORGANISM="Favella taraikaensis, Strain Fe Narragansett Bay" /NCGR_SAMPLE_ID=MMETSP0434 /ASSEMBLY_ACC=CAM_ASM_000379 /LENGTH=151 /DNA_ID=CAMNT_0028190395 /DNA_START=488 /DNA_END=943 /DNA_ORIENTATION=+
MYTLPTKPASNPEATVEERKWSIRDMLMETGEVQEDKLAISVIPGSEQDPTTLTLPPAQVSNARLFQQLIDGMVAQILPGQDLGEKICYEMTAVFGLLLEALDSSDASIIDEFRTWCQNRQENFRSSAVAGKEESKAASGQEHGIACSGCD